MIARPVQRFVLDVCQQLGVVTVLTVMAFVFMGATQEIGAQTASSDTSLPDLSQPLDSEINEVRTSDQDVAKSEATPTLQDFATQKASLVVDNQMELDLAELQRSYRGQLEEYRTLHQQFVVAREEFNQLGTLSSLEAAVQATQKVFIMRDQVLLTYLEILELETRLASALDAQLEEESLFVLEETQKAVTRHLEDTQASTDRASIQERSLEFENIAELYSFSSVFAKQVLQLGTLQESYQQAGAIFEDLPLELVGQTQLEKAARARALEQIEFQLSQAKTLLAEQRLEIIESLQDVRVSSSDTSNEVYVVLQRIVGFLDEVHQST
jgi:hypothetical protein